VAALFSTTAPMTVVVARSKNVTVDAQAVLKALVQRFGGRGGGKPDLAQGGGFEGDVNSIVDAARAIIEGQLRPTTDDQD
jgi:alanyl-tRNA synthetase